MDAGNIERLELKSGEKVTAEHVAQLDRTITRNTGLRGARMRRYVRPWGTSYVASGGGGGLASAPQFQPDVTFDEKGNAEVRWTGPTAMIGGIVPTIGTDANSPRIFTPDDKTGLTPALTVDRQQYSDLGECLIYFRLAVYPSSFQPATVVPMALKAAPPPEPYVTYKLALFLRIRAGQPSYDEQDDRELFSGQGFLAINQKPDGKFEPLWWAKFG